MGNVLKKKLLICFLSLSTQHVCIADGRGLDLTLISLKSKQFQTQRRSKDKHVPQCYTVQTPWLPADPLRYITHTEKRPGQQQDAKLKSFCVCEISESSENQHRTGQLKKRKNLTFFKHTTQIYFKPAQSHYHQTKINPIQPSLIFSESKQFLIRLLCACTRC